MRPIQNASDPEHVWSGACPILWSQGQWEALKCISHAGTIYRHTDIATSRLQYGLRWIESRSQRWGPGSRWDHLLASYVTLIKRSHAFWYVFKTPNPKLWENWKYSLQSWLFSNLSMFGVFKLIYRCDIRSQEVIPSWPRTLSRRAGPYPSNTLNCFGESLFKPEEKLPNMNTINFEKVGKPQGGSDNVD